MKALRIQQVADLLGIHRNSVWRMLRTRQDFPRPARIGPRLVVWLESDIESWLRQQKEKTHGSGNETQDRTE